MNSKSGSKVYDSGWGACQVTTMSNFNPRCSELELMMGLDNFEPLSINVGMECTSKIFQFSTSNNTSFITHTALNKTHILSLQNWFPK